MLPLLVTISSHAQSTISPIPGYRDWWRRRTGLAAAWLRARGLVWLTGWLAGCRAEVKQPLQRPKYEMFYYGTSKPMLTSPRVTVRYLSDALTTAVRLHSPPSPVAKLQFCPSPAIVIGLGAKMKHYIAAMAVFYQVPPRVTLPWTSRYISQAVSNTYSYLQQFLWKKIPALHLPCTAFPSSQQAPTQVLPPPTPGNIRIEVSMRVLVIVL
jgi:hypothetical protein